jgi:uridine kinase
MIVLLIDGRSGSGKTELATAIGASWPEAQLVHLDDIYPGWGGLDAASAHVHEEILTNYRWRGWDWATSEPEEWHELDPERPLIIEGCGALSAENRALATYGIWVECPDDVRRQRALDREPDFAEHWEEWAAQEAAFIEREHPETRADAIVDGTDVTPDVARWRRLLDPARVGE